MKDIKAAHKTFYDRNANDRDAGERQAWKDPVRDGFLKRILGEGKTSLLEIGAGPGKDSRFFMDNGLCVAAVDLSGEMVKLCREKGVEAYERDFYTLSGLGRTFDCVWSMNCLLHVPKADLPLVLAEIDAVLNPAGLFHYGVYGGADIEETWDDKVYGMPRFYSHLSDETLQAVTSEFFEIVAFDKINTEKGANRKQWNFQSLILRKK